MIKQKLRMSWFSEGDRNTSFYHASFKSKHNRDNINILDLDSELQSEPLIINEMFLSYFRDLLGNLDNFTP